MTDMFYERLSDNCRTMLFPQSHGVDRCIIVAGADRPHRLGASAAVRAGVFLGIMAIGFGAWACLWPQSHLWNARLLPFMYLTRPAGGHRRGEIGLFIARLLAPRARRVARRSACRLGTLGFAVIAVPGRPRRCHFRNLPFFSQRMERDGSGSTPAGRSRRRARPALRRRLGQVELLGLRGQGRLRRVLRRRQHHEAARPGAGLRPGPLGEQQRRGQLRHADGAHAAAVLDRRLHRLDGGPLTSRPRAPRRTTSSPPAPMSEHSSNPVRRLAVRRRRRRQGRASTCRRWASATTSPSARRSSPRPTPTRTSRRSPSPGRGRSTRCADSDLVVPLTTAAASWPAGADSNRDSLARARHLAGSSTRTQWAGDAGRRRAGGLAAGRRSTRTGADQRPHAGCGGRRRRPCSPRRSPAVTVERRAHVRQLASRSTSTRSACRCW